MKKKLQIVLFFLFAIFSVKLMAQSTSAFKINADSLYDDFEDGDTLSAWGGPWTYFVDTDSTSTIFAEVTGDDGYNGSNYSFHVSGQFKSFGGGVGLFDAAQGPHDFQGIFGGISFAAKGDTVPVRVRVREKKAESQRGYAYFGKIFTPTSEWQIYTIPFDSMTPQYGDPVPPFDATDLYAIDWGPAFVDSSIDVYIDDIYFLQAVTVGIEEENHLPSNFTLKQNYPNPFNPATTIEFSLAKRSNVTLKIFDILGNEIKTLLAGYLQTGLHKVKFNASDIPSGIYFYKLQTNVGSLTKKMILLK